MLDQQIPYGVEAFSFVATPTAILVYEAKTVRVIPIRDIMWIYGNVVKQTMITTGGFSKKAPLDEAVAQLQNLLFPYRKGIVYGYSDEIANYFQGNFAGAVQMVDAKSMEP